MDDRSRNVLRAAGYAGCVAAASNPLTQWYNGRLPLNSHTLMGAAGFVAVVVLFTLVHRLLRSSPNPDTLHMRLLILLQAPFALLACWGFRGYTMCTLLVVFAAQLPPRFATRPMLVVLIAVDAGLAWVLSQYIPWGDVGSVLLGYSSFQAFAVIIVSYARRTEHARDELLLINAELLATRRLLAESTRSEERLRLSRELHDVVGHKLTALKLQLRLRARDAGTDSQLEECMRLSDELLSDVRSVVSALRTDDGIDLHAALAALVPAVPRPKIRLELAPDARVAGIEQAQTLLRCAQEGLTNALRHSDAEHVALRLQRSAGGVSISIEDDGSASQPPRWGNGLNGMRERLQALGGVLEVAVNGRHGLRVNAWLPLPLSGA
jgi:signal transduction histidine kinase